MNLKELYLKNVRESQEREERNNQNLIDFKKAWKAEYSILYNDMLIEQLKYQLEKHKDRHQWYITFPETKDILKVFGKYDLGVSLFKDWLKEILIIPDGFVLERVCKTKPTAEQPGYVVKLYFKDNNFNIHE